ncbi:MAG: MFS transporter [Bacteroidales bacterium]|jgi:nucleoside transporter|nr:MFS transporter [Bacteroidales bacterium]MCI2121637.1 MFS transporter [Bacteroidales bacterium]MCI2146281.1 MFS transporter [Bacteroidales bacterium]
MENTAVLKKEGRGGIVFRLIIMNFLEFAIWGAYLTCMGRYLGVLGFGKKIGIFYSIQGIVSIFMPALIGIVADKWIQAQKTLSICQLLAGIFMIAAWFYGKTNAGNVQFGPLFTLYTISVAFFMPTIALTNTVAYAIMERHGMDTVKDFPPIRTFGTIGFICSMWVVDIFKFQTNEKQFLVSGILSLALALYALTLPSCPTHGNSNETIAEKLGLTAFKLFKRREMAVFFIFSMLLGVCLQITNGYANPYIGDFGFMPKYAGTFGVEHANILISISQISEACCILLIPFFLKKFGIKIVMLIAMFAWVLRFFFFGVGNPGNGLWLLILSMLVYGVAFDFFNISGSLFVNQETDKKIQASAQGLFMLMTNGLGASIGLVAAQAVIDRFVNVHAADAVHIAARMKGWTHAWFTFSAYALVVAILFMILFRYKRQKDRV